MPVSPIAIRTGGSPKRLPVPGASVVNVQLYGAEGGHVADTTMDEYKYLTTPPPMLRVGTTRWWTWRPRASRYQETQCVDIELSAQPVPAIVSDVWTWNTQAPPPINGQLRSNNSQWVNAQSIAIATKAQNNTDYSAGLASLQPNGHVYVYHNTDNTRWAKFHVNAQPTVQPTYVSYAVTYADGGGVLPTSNTQILVSLQPAVPGSVRLNLYTWDGDQVGSFDLPGSAMFPHPPAMLNQSGRYFVMHPRFGQYRMGECMPITITPAAVAPAPIAQYAVKPVNAG